MATLTRERDSLAKQLSGSTAAFEEKLQGVKEACMCLHENLEHVPYSLNITPVWQNCPSPSRAVCDEAHSGSVLQGNGS